MSGGGNYLGNSRHQSNRKDRSDGNTGENNIISFKYTIDYPKIELNPFDTKKMAIYYNDNDFDKAS